MSFTTEVSEMVPDESSVTEPAGEAPKEKEKPKLGTLSAVEKVVNEYARKFAKRNRVGEDEFTVILASGFTRGIMGIKRGPVAQIILQWPEAQPSINTLLESAFKLIAKRHMVDTMAVESTLVIRKRVEERRRWVREKLGDEADIILDLIPRHRIRTTVTTSVKYEDVVTGESYTVTHQSKPEQYRGQDVSSWLKLSRIVRDNHPEEATRYEPEPEDVTAVVGELSESEQSADHSVRAG